MEWLPYALQGTNHRFRDYWYYSFKVFFAQGLSTSFQSMHCPSFKWASFYQL